MSGQGKPPAIYQDGSAAISSNEDRSREQQLQKLISKRDEIMEKLMNFDIEQSNENGIIEVDRLTGLKKRFDSLIKEMSNSTKPKHKVNDDNDSEYYDIEKSSSDDDSYLASDNDKNYDSDSDYESDIDRVLIIERTNNIGNYYSFTNQKGKNCKFYFEKESAKIQTLFDKFDKYPTWIKELSGFCEKWHFDNITKMHKKKNLDDVQNKILMNVILNSIDGEIKDIAFDMQIVTDFIEIINEQFIDYYPREKKDKMWKSILVDEYCSNRHGYQSKILKLLLLEKYSCPIEQKSLLSHSYLNRKIRGTLAKNFQTLVKMFIIDKKEFSSLEMSPKKYVRYIISCIQEIKVERQIYDEIDVKCEHCDSRFHNSKNCLMKYKNLRQEKSNN